MKLLIKTFKFVFLFFSVDILGPAFAVDVVGAVVPGVVVVTDAFVAERLVVGHLSIWAKGPLTGASFR